MNDFVFQNTTKIYFGRNQLQHLGEEVRQFGSRVLLAYGGGSVKKSGLYDKVMAELKKASMTVFELPGVEPNPRHTTVNKGAELCRREKVDVVLAVGGGSTIDCVKAVAATVFSKSGDCWDLVKGKDPVTKALPIVTVLTIAATGSEMDAGGVISNVDTQEKLGLIHPLLQPKVSFLDPANTFTVNAYQTACGSVDIMSHVFDTAYFARDERMDMLYRMMDELLKTVVRFAPAAIARPDDYEARANLMWAASWALNGFLYGGVAQAPSCHMIEHELSAVEDGVDHTVYLRCRRAGRVQVVFTHSGRQIALTFHDVVIHDRRHHSLAGLCTIRCLAGEDLRKRLTFVHCHRPVHAGVCRRFGRGQETFAQVREAELLRLGLYRVGIAVFVCIDDVDCRHRFRRRLAGLRLDERRILHT